MNHCVIALYFENYYISVVCHYHGAMDIGDKLRQSYCCTAAAEKIVVGGDISCFGGASPCHFQSTWGYSWNQVKPIVHESSRAFVEYALAVGATHIVVFEEETWTDIPLTRKSYDDILSKESVIAA